VSDSNARPTD